MKKKSILILERGRVVQPSFVGCHPSKHHQDPQIIKAQNWIETHSSHAVCIDDLASFVGMGLRNFKRRFKNATGDSPLVYVQKLRMESAKTMLEKNQPESKILPARWDMMISVFSGKCLPDMSA